MPPLHSDFLLVTESKDQRKQWIEALQDQNPDLVASEHSLRIHPDTPQLTHRSGANGQNGGANKTEDSPPVVYPPRPGSPRHDIHRMASDDSSLMDHLDIQHLNISCSPSDNEDDNL